MKADDNTVSSDLPINLPQLKQTKPPVLVESEHLLDWMISATLGTTTTEALQWNHKKNQFTYNLEGERPIGLGRKAAEAQVINIAVEVLLH